jgi:hypothetical protein
MAHIMRALPVWTALHPPLQRETDSSGMVPLRQIPTQFCAGNGTSFMRW